MRRPLFFLCVILVFAVWLKITFFEEDVGPGWEDGQTVYISGRICKIEDFSIQIRPITFLDANLHPIQSINQKEYLLCESQDVLFLSQPLGRNVIISGEFQKVAAAGNPGEFDYKVYYRSINICGRLKKARLLKWDDSIWPVREQISRLQRTLVQRLKALFPTEYAGQMCALLLGDRTELDSEVKALYQRSGILHILSISSLHITMIGMSIYHFLRKRGVSIGIAAPLGGVLLILYGCLTGFGNSAKRAIGMFLLRMAADLLGRTYDMLTALGVVGAVMVWKNPYLLQNTGFLLSFTSVLGIVGLAPILTGRDKAADKKSRSKFRKVFLTVRQNFLSSLGITLSTLPVQLTSYYEVPVWSCLTNLFVLPFVKILVGCGMVCLLPGFSLAKYPCIAILKFYDSICRGFDSLPVRTWCPGCPSTFQILLYCMVVLAAIFFTDEIRKYRKNAATKTGRAYRSKKPAVLALWEKIGNHPGLVMRKEIVAKRVMTMMKPAFILVLLFVITPHTGRDGLAVFLDVGQGDCCLVQTMEGKCYLFDCGSSSRKKLAEKVVIPCMKYYGITRLDGIFLSHSDADHVNGVKELLKKAEEGEIAISCMILPNRKDMLAEFDTVFEGDELWGMVCPVLTVKAGAESHNDATRLYVVHPGDESTIEDSNENSLCVYAKTGAVSILFTGDVGMEGESALGECLRLLGEKTPDILKVAHHGSRYSGSLDFLKLVKPKVAVISCGAGNKYGHPHEETLQRLEEINTIVYRTDEDGAIIVQVQGESINISTTHKKASETVK